MAPLPSLDPYQMVNDALSRVNASPFDYEALTKAALDRVLNVTSTAALNTADAMASTSVQVGRFRFVDINWAAYLHGLPFHFIEIWKTISFFASLILAILFFSIWLRLRPLNRPEISLAEEITPPQPAPGGPMTARWQEIMDHMGSVKEAQWKFAIIEADKLAEDALKKAGFPGDTLGERLALIQPGQLQNLEGLWEAHKIRNRVAHDLQYFLRYTEAKHAIAQYEGALRELGAL